MEKIKQRCEIDDSYKWDLSKIYSSNDEIKSDLNRVLLLTEELCSYDFLIYHFLHLNF